ncbi:MAG: DUF4372 domain-containing protein [Burkholderiales bacterium]|nr:DUF4372 domain-containing protein [Burkholderiales bacterium]MCP5252632.1 DUF4372 domain-containing protein [Burkholderiales bacterium]
MKQKNNVLTDKAHTALPLRSGDRAHEGEYRIRTFNCWTRLVAMIYAQIAQRVSFRDLQTAFSSHATCHCHLGMTLIRRLTLADPYTTCAWFLPRNYVLVDP